MRSRPDLATLLCAFLAIALLLPSCSQSIRTVALSSGDAPGGDAIGDISAGNFNQRFTTQAFDDGRATVTPSPTFDGLGFAGVTKTGTLFAVERRGNSSIDPSGQVAFYEWHGPATGWVARGIFDSPWDDRNVAGGVAQDGSIVVFLARYDTITGRWVDMGFVRSGDEGFTFSRYQTIPVGPDRWFSPYGPMVTLPGGRLMQTFYGNDGYKYRLRALFSDDNGAHWGHESIIDQSASQRPTEAAAVVVGGTAASNARLLVVARTSPGFGGAGRGGMVQYVSGNGGRTWLRQGVLPVAGSQSDISPWIAHLSRGRLALVWTSRASMSIVVSIQKAAAVFRSNRAWPRPWALYRSRLADQRPRQAANFGYPSVGSIGPDDADQVVVFFDASVNDPGLFPERSQANTDLVVIRLEPRRGTRR